MANQTYKITPALLKKTVNQLTAGLSDYIGLGNKKVPVTSPTAQRIINMPATQKAIQQYSGGGTVGGGGKGLYPQTPTPISAGIASAAKPVSPMAGAAGSVAPRRNALDLTGNFLGMLGRTIAPNLTSGVQRTLSAIKARPASPSYTSSTSIEDNGSWLSNGTPPGDTTPTPSGPPSFDDPRIKEVARNRAMMNLMTFGDETLKKEMELQSELAAIPEFGDLTLSGAKQFAGMRGGEYSTMRGANMQAMYNLATQGQEEKDRALEAEKFVVTQQLNAPTGTSFEFQGKNYEGLAPNEESKPQLVKYGDDTFVYENGKYTSFKSKIAEGAFDMPDAPRHPEWGPGYQCGEGYNNVTNGPKVGDTLRDKTKYIDKGITAPSVGNGFVLPIGANGHVETVLGYDPGTGSIATVGWNRGLQGEKAYYVYTKDQWQAELAKGGGFINSTLKSNYMNDVQTVLDSMGFSETAASWQEEAVSTVMNKYLPTLFESDYRLKDMVDKQLKEDKEIDYDAVDDHINKNYKMEDRQKIWNSVYVYLETKTPETTGKVDLNMSNEDLMKKSDAFLKKRPDYYSWIFE